MNNRKKIHIIGGGTLFHVRPHLALAAPAYGSVAHQLFQMCNDEMSELETVLNLTKMAGGKTIETNRDVENLIGTLCADPATKIIMMPVALCDFKVESIEETLLEEGGVYEPDDDNDYMHYPTTITIRHECGKEKPRLKSLTGAGMKLVLHPSEKLIAKIRQYRKDIFLVGFKTTTDATEQEQYVAGLHLLKASSCNLVLANDIKNQRHMVITPEEAKYHVTYDREEALRGMVQMASLRSHLTFTRSTVIAGEPVPWSSPDVPETLRKVVDHCIEQGAYKPFRGATVGHFAVKLTEDTFLTSRRKTNFNDLDKIGLVKIKTDGPDTVYAYGSKPSVGGQSQRIVFEEHPEYDCIVHFHCPIKNESIGTIPLRSQREVECGSHECGRNTSGGLARFGNLSAVYLDMHGPNIVFNHSIDPKEVIDFIDAHFDLTKKTGGYVNE